MNGKELFEKIMENYTRFKSRAEMCKKMRFSPYYVNTLDKEYPELAKVWAYFIDEQIKERERNAEKYNHEAIDPVPSPVGGYEAFCYAVTNGCPVDIALSKCKISRSDYDWLKARAEILGFFKDTKKEVVKDWTRWNPKNHLPGA